MKEIITAEMHIHILPGLDDGARDMETTEKMLELAYADGIRTIICTPHFHGGHMEPGRALTEETFNKVKAYAEDRYSGMKLYLGNEVYYFDSMTEWLSDNRLYTMAGSCYVLTEFSPDVTLREIESAVINTTRAGFVPILAHINRYSALVGNIKAVTGLIRAGALIQVNAEALNSDMSFRIRHFTKKLLKAGLVDFIATDAHSCGRRRPGLRKYYLYVSRHYGKDYADRIFSANQLKLINNDVIDNEGII